MDELLKIPTDFHDNTRVWIFQSNRPFTEAEERDINDQLHNFYAQWQSHGAAVKGWARLLYKHFIVVLADEEATGVSGCSTDAMTRVVKSLERQYKVTFFDRLTLSFLVHGKVEMLPLNQVSYALQKGYIETDTPLFNNLVNTKKNLLDHWLQPLHKSWLWERVVSAT